MVYRLKDGSDDVRTCYDNPCVREYHRNCVYNQIQRTVSRNNSVLESWVKTVRNGGQNGNGDIGVFGCE